MSLFLLKTALPAIALISLGACQNYFVKPNIIPAGYAYHDQKYKTIPSPNPVDLGYAYTEEQNAEVIRSIREKAAQLLDQIEQRNEIPNKTVFVFTPHDHNAQNATFDHVLREELADRNYRITQDQSEGLIIGFSIREPRNLEEHVDFGNLNGEHRDDHHKTRINTYEKMIVEMALMDGPQTLDVVSAVYDMPMYGYDRDNFFNIRKPAVGQQPERFSDKNAAE